MKEDLKEPELGNKPTETKNKFNYELFKLLSFLGVTIILIIVTLTVL